MSNLVTLPEIIDGINNKNLLLPHFQREYVWNKAQQKKLILSVLTGLPASSSLILKKHKGDSYKCLKIGMRNEILSEVGEGDCYYLLDGQQRITTLYYAFHNIFQLSKRNNEIIYDKLDNKLRKRWFLNFTYNGSSILNYSNLVYDQQLTEMLLPEDIEGFISFKEISKQNLADGELELEKIEEDCKLDKKIPLSFFLDNKTELKRILKKIFDDRLDQIQSKKENSKALLELLKSKNFRDVEEKVRIYYQGDQSEIDKFIENNGYKDEWVDGIFDHFNAVLKNYEIHPIKMEDRNKAVKTFEYINTGGTNLSAFDLLCAKVGAFSLRQNVIEETKKKFDFFSFDLTKEESFHLVDNFGLISGNSKNPSVEKKYAEYLAQVLNLIHFKKTKLKNPNSKEFTSQLLKSKYSLEELEPEFIEKNYKEAVRVIKNTAALLQVFCSHRNINSITNYLSLIQIFVFFVYWEGDFSKNELKRIIGIFWLNLFLGRYDSHQNENAIEDAKNIYQLLFLQNSEKLQEIINKINVDLFADEGFANKESLTTRKCNKSLEDNFFMFLRSLGNKFLDLNKEAQRIEVDDDIEIHHIIPLSNAVKVGESTRKIRRDNYHLLNATMNKTPITKTTNREISNKNIIQYCQDLKTFNTQFDHHFITPSWSEITYKEENSEKIKNLFEARFDIIAGEIRKKIDSFINI